MALWLALAVGAASFYFLLRFLRPNSKFKDLPGPLAIPLLGNIFQIISAFKAHNYPFTHFAEKYGEIYRLKIPLREIVVLASYEAVQTVLSKEESLGRDISGIAVDRNYGLNLGIAFGNGKMWEDSRHWVIRNLREYGWGKSKVLEESVNTEIGDFFQKLDKNEKDGQQILAIHQTFLTPVSHIMYKMMAGEHAIIEKETLDDMNEQTALLEKAAGPTGTLGNAITIYFPAFRFLFPEWTGRNILLKCGATLLKESTKLMSEAKGKMSKPGAVAGTLTEKFVQEMKSGTNPNPEIFTELNYGVIFADMFQAASNTTASFLESIFLFLILHPNLQEKVYSEILDTIPAGQEITYEDKHRMTYTHAVFMEVHRCAKITQYLIPRKATEEFSYKDYRIKKNTVILADVNSLYSNPEIFKEPLKFNPDRFLDSNGNIVDQKKIISFSVGKRNCPGELFADVTAFLFALNFIRKFKLSCIPGQPKPRSDMHIGFTSCPHPFSVVLTSRQ